MTALLVVLAGVLIGLSLGTLGGGGAILAVPALVYLLGQDAQEATAGSLVIVGTTSVLALVPHARRGHVRFGQGALFGALGIAGSIIGSRANTLIRPELLLVLFAGLLLVVGILMLRRSRRVVPSGAVAPQGHPTVGRPAVRVSWRYVLRLVLTATAVGLLTGFFGVGGGFALVPALVLALSFPMPVAVGTSLLVIAINSATALAARGQAVLSLDWPVIAGFSAVAVVASLLGARLAGRLPERRLTAAFALLLLAVAVFMGTNALLDLG